MRLSLNKIFYICASIFVIISSAYSAVGASERVVLDQYEISFDLDTLLSHTIEVQPPVLGENDTSYSAYIKFTNETQILMGIDIFKTAKDATLEPELKIVQMYAKGDENATVTTRYVDGKSGIQTSSTSKSGDPTFTFRSWIDSQKCDCGDVFAATARLEILGIVPTNISENLLNSLHVVSLTAAQTPNQVGSSTNKSLLSGRQGPATSEDIMSSNVSTSRLDSAKIAYIENAWLESFYPVDPAYYQLHAWANQ